MAPIKYEEQMKEKLEKRSLTPTPESWAALSNRLDAQQKNTNKSLFWWFGIAASVVGIVFITTLYFNGQPVENTSPIIVESDTEAIPEKTKEDLNTNQTYEIAVEEVNPSEISSKGSNSKSDVISSKIKTKVTSIQLETDVAQVENNSVPESVESVSGSTKNKLSFEDLKIQDIVAQIKELNADGQTVSDAEIDSLLKKAQKEILNNRLYNQNTRTVDANALLQDVETDLQQSFRSKVFKALQTGYDSVITAVAERNH